MLALIGYQTTAEGEGGTNETSVGRWLRRRSDSLGTLAKSLFTFNRDNYKSINESETSMSSPHCDDDGPYVCLGDRSANNTLAKASIVFHQAYH